MALLLWASLAWAPLSLLCLALMSEDRHSTGSLFNGGKELWRQIRKFSATEQELGAHWDLSEARQVEIGRDDAWFNKVSWCMCQRRTHMASRCEGILNIYPFALFKLHTTCCGFIFSELPLSFVYSKPSFISTSDYYTTHSRSHYVKRGLSMNPQILHK